jgi:hypothetical protein
MTTGDASGARDGPGRWLTGAARVARWPAPTVNLPRQDGRAVPAFAGVA